MALVTMRQLLDEAVISLPRARPKPAAVDADDGGVGARPVRPRHIEMQVLAVRVGILNVVFGEDGLLGTDSPYCRAKQQHGEACARNADLTHFRTPPF